MNDGLDEWLWDSLPPTEWEQTKAGAEQSEPEDDPDEQEDA